MRILTVLTYYSPHWTGLTAHAARVAEGLAARGHVVTVLTTRYRRDLTRDEMINGVRVVRIRPIARFSRGMITPAFPLAAALLIRKHDAVHIHTPLPEAPLVALLCRLLGRPMLMTHHGDLVMPPGLFNRALEWIGYALTYAAGRLASRVTSYSLDYAKHSKLLRHFNQKLTAVYPPVDIPEPDRRAASAWKAELGLSGRSLVGFAGRWVSEKGFDDLLRALPLVRQQVPQAHLVFAGEQRVVYEDFYEKCRALIEPIREHITLLGLLRDRQQMANFYAMCDLFVLPSRTDMMALVQIEALLCGTPVVASDIPGARVVVRETGFGRLTPPGEPEALARAIVAGLRRRGALVPTRWQVEKVFNSAQSISGYEGLLLDLKARPRPGRPAYGSNGGIEAVSMTTPPILRVPNGDQPWDSLSAADHEVLDRVLLNEADMAFRRRARILLDYLELKDGDRVIDLGCGIGFYLMAMRRLRDLTLVGLDRELLRLRQAWNVANGASLVMADMVALPFRENSFDKALMSEVLEHLPDDQSVLRLVHRLLKPGGILAVSVPHSNYPFWWDPINGIFTRLGGAPIRSGPLVGIWTNHERLYHPMELIEGIQTAGFQVQVVEEATHHAFPLSHFLVYGVGKPLLERNLLPQSLARNADRLRGVENSGNSLNPINLGLAAFRAVDRLNERPSAAKKQTFVNVLVKARKPARDGR